jgi:hypothetical protein
MAVWGPKTPEHPETNLYNRDSHVMIRTLRLRGSSLQDDHDARREGAKGCLAILSSEEGTHSCLQRLWCSSLQGGG